MTEFEKLSTKITMINLLKKYVPTPIKDRIYRNFLLPKWKGNHRIFCISFQRTGTTSFGDFFEYFGYPRASSLVSKKNSWSKLLYEKSEDEIFNSKDFKRFQVFEDNPWWTPGFFKTLYQRFPTAKFILIERNSKDWFASMVKHSGGKTLGNTRRHAQIYNREDEFNERLKNDPEFKPTDNDIDNLLELKGMDKHYIQVYENHIKSVKKFFKETSPNSLLVVDLEDPDKWYKIGEFVGIEVPKDFDIHSNKSIQR